MFFKQLTQKAKESKGLTSLWFYGIAAGLFFFKPWIASKSSSTFVLFVASLNIMEMMSDLGKIMSITKDVMSLCIMLVYENVQMYCRDFIIRNAYIYET